MCALILLYVYLILLYVCDCRCAQGPYTTLYISYCSTYVTLLCPYTTLYTYVIVGALRDLLHVEELAEQECHEKEGAHGAQSDRSLQLLC